MTKPSGWKHVPFALLLCGAMAIAVSAQTFDSLVSFDQTNGAEPISVLIQGRDGNFYGTASGGGMCDADCGTVFRVTPGGTLTTLYKFCSQPECTDGFDPQAPLFQATDGNFYGTTMNGGSPQSCGTIFKMSPVGKLTTIFTFCPLGSDGLWPQGGLIQGRDGNFYGTTMRGGDGGACGNGCGTVFKITPDGTLTTLHTFDIYDGWGAAPMGGLIQATDGNFYGTTSGDAGNSCTSECATVFRITADGGYALLYIFCLQSGCPDGTEPRGRLIQAADGNFYGTTVEGGANGFGTVFKITPAGTLTTLYSFCMQVGCADGSQPAAGLIQATDGNLYGTTSLGGANGWGTAFEVTPSGVLTTLHNFDLTDGGDPASSLLQATNGIFYGATAIGGTYSKCDDGDGSGCGTLFSSSTGLGPFVSLARSSGKVGQTSGILGQGFTGTTSVSYNGTPGTFTVKSDTYLMATVPPGAMTGPVTVATPSGTLTSNVPFRVTPAILSFYPPSGPVGTQVIITGKSLTQAIRVGFGDYTPANFTVNSDTQVTATVPKGAKTGPLGIETLGGTAISSSTFTVTP
ncbi:MAG TPA: choice-of-anchor tandem repeat GloVer-containing protein [Terriglobales bacterium]|jgi:uncharacterized repeat protein (TIGR03803 family)|nr:choice-of-anchor tandem repeat GloVer-containing protein [Terriglobales bacterium]